MPSRPEKPQPRIQLSRQEIRNISEEISRDFSPRYRNTKTRNLYIALFCSHELLEISREISKEYAPSLDDSRPTLVLLPVSPTRLHAYWHSVNRPTPAPPEQAEQRESMVLRIYTQSKASATEPESNQSRDNWIDIAVDEEHGHLDINIPPPPAGTIARQYCAVLGNLQANQSFKVWIHANTSDMAQFPAQPDVNNQNNPVAQFIMSNFMPASSAGLPASAQGKQSSR